MTIAKSLDLEFKAEELASLFLGIQYDPCEKFDRVLSQTINLTEKVHKNIARFEILGRFDLVDELLEKEEKDTIPFLEVLVDHQQEVSDLLKKKLEKFIEERAGIARGRKDSTRDSWILLELKNKRGG